MRAGRFVAVVVISLCGVAAAAQTRGGTIAGRIITPDGVAAADVEVFAAPRGQPRAPIARTRSAWDGRYELTGVPAGSFLVGAFTDPRLLTLYPGVAESDPAAAVTVLDGVAAEGIDIWLLPSPGRFHVGGRVTDVHGIGLRHVDLEYGRADGSQARIWSVRHPDGFFTIEGAASGTLVLLARAQTPDGLLMGIASTEVTVGAVEDVRIVAARPGRVEGRIVAAGGAWPGDARPRIALAQTLLTASALYPDPSAVANARGAFVIDDVLGHVRIEVRELPPGWAVRRIARAGVSLNQPLVVHAGETVAGVEIEVGPR